MNDRGWLAKYLSYTETQESPTIFHMWCGISVLAAVMNKKVWLPRTSEDGIERYRSWPGQMSIILVAGAGKAKKSTAIDIAQSFMKAAGVCLFDGKITPEKLLAKMSALPSGHAIMTLVASELSVFLNKQQYNEHLIDILTKLFDCRDDAYETQTRTFELRDVCLTLLAGTTPRSIGTSIPTSATETGFLSRYCLIYAEKSGKVEPLTTTNANPDVVRRSMQLKHELLEGLKYVSTLNGPFDWEPEAKAWYEDWYHSYMSSPQSDAEGWAQRRPDHLLRLAMILQVSANMNLCFQAGTLESADAMLTNSVELLLPRALAHVGKHIDTEGQDRIIDVVRRFNGQAKSSDIFVQTLKYFKSIRELQLAIRSLEVAGIMAKSTSLEGVEEWKLIREPY